ncbi:hypothetical protein PAXRUDRAFT_16570 [Paxillus rubicundulus Ve08.2h10]|uniref:Unplaced genomic scaffold scaffold_1584, whole genome shotgun sequence n=1 Tax=Paxillus rubicundulus Ve08.2h10 TaxID=930991 RepID=A0A0D0D5V2_9AGAM|nr:hypothetical protein PAXRUDRAFT_16570 [Paxillus rubicundulus Ve08.2h10]
MTLVATTHVMNAIDSDIFVSTAHFMNVLFVVASALDIFNSTVPLDNLMTTPHWWKNHEASKKHQCNLSRATRDKNPVQPALLPVPSSSGAIGTSSPLVEHEPEALPASGAHQQSPSPIAIDGEWGPSGPELPLSDLWNEFRMEHTVQFEDYFQEMQKELGIEADEETSMFPPDFAIDVRDPGTRTTHNTSTGVNVPPNALLYPWKLTAEFATHLLFSSPRLRFSQAQKNAVLAWARELGAPEKLLGDPMEQVKTVSGNTFYLSAISKAVTLDFANPLTCFAMQDYPEDDQGRMLQVHHGNKMLEGLPDDLAPPCVCVDGSIYFVNKLVQQQGNQYFIPKKFFQARLSLPPAEATVLSLGHKVQQMGEGFSVDPEMEIVSVSTFRLTFDELRCQLNESNISFTSSSAAHASLMPNPWREKSGGRMVMTVPLIIFMDDVSGNISKQWNKHHVVYMSNALLPREMLEKEFCTRFVPLSPHAKPLELMQGIKDSLKKAASDPIIAYDVKHQDEVMLIPYNLFVAGNNPMQAKECSHGGLKCNYLCHTCKVGGTNAEKKTDEGYTSLFECGQLWTPEDTVAEIKCQIELAKLSGGMKKLESELDALLGGLSIDDHINPLLGMCGVDIHKDTPMEILHTILLSIVKYFWGQTAFILDKAHLLQTFQTRLDSVNKDGLNSPTLGADYIFRYKGGLIGKHFKSLAQVMPYLVYNLVPTLSLMVGFPLADS